MDYVYVIVYCFPFEFAGICLSYRLLDGDFYKKIEISIEI